MITMGEIASKHRAPARSVELDRTLNLSSENFNIHADDTSIRLTNRDSDTSLTLEWPQFEALVAEGQTMKRILESAQKES